MAAAIVQNPEWSLKQYFDFSKTYILNHDYFPEKSSRQVVQNPTDPKKLERLNELERLRKDLHSKPITPAPKPWFDFKNMQMGNIDPDNVEEYARLFLTAAEAARRLRRAQNGGDGGDDDDNPGGPGPGGAWGADDPRGGPQPPRPPGGEPPDQGGPDNNPPGGDGGKDDEGPVTIQETETLTPNETPVENQQQATIEEEQANPTTTPIVEPTPNQVASAPVTAEVPIVTPTTQPTTTKLIVTPNNQLEANELVKHGIVPELAVELANEKIGDVARSTNTGYHEIINKVPETETEVEKKVDDTLDILNQAMIQKTRETYNGTFFSLSGPGTIPPQFLEQQVISNTEVPMDTAEIFDKTTSREITGFENVFNFKSDLFKPTVVNQFPMKSELPFGLRPIGQINLTQFIENKDVYKSDSSLGDLTKTSSLDYFNEVLGRVKSINPLIKHLIGTESMSEKFIDLARIELKETSQKDWYQLIQGMQAFNSKYCINPNYYETAIPFQKQGLYLLNDKIKETQEFKTLAKENEKLILSDPADDVYYDFKDTFKDKDGKYTYESVTDNWDAFKSAAITAGAGFAAVGLSALIIANLRRTGLDAGRAFLGGLGGVVTTFMGRPFFGNVRNQNEEAWNQPYFGGLTTAEPTPPQNNIIDAATHAATIQGGVNQILNTPLANTILPPPIIDRTIDVAGPGTSGLQRVERGYDQHTREEYGDFVPRPKKDDNQGRDEEENDDDDHPDDNNDRGAEKVAINQEQKEVEKQDETMEEPTTTEPTPPPDAPAAAPTPTEAELEAAERIRVEKQIDALNKLRMQQDIFLKTISPNLELGTTNEQDKAKLVVAQIKEQLRIAEQRYRMLDLEIPRFQSAYDRGVLTNTHLLKEKKKEHEEKSNLIMKLKNEKENLERRIREVDPQYFSSVTSLNDLSSKDLYATTKSIFEKENLLDKTMIGGLFKGNKQFVDKFKKNQLISNIFGQIDAATSSHIQSKEISTKRLEGTIVADLLEAQPQANGQIGQLVFSSLLERKLVNLDYNVNFVMRRVFNSIEKATIEWQKYMLGVMQIKNSEGKVYNAHKDIHRIASEELLDDLIIMRKFDLDGYRKIMEIVTDPENYTPKIYQTNDEGYLFWKFTPQGHLLYDYSAQKVNNLQFESNVLLARDAVEDLPIKQPDGPNMIPDNQKENQEAGEDTKTLVEEQGTIDEEPDQELDDVLNEAQEVVNKFNDPRVHDVFKSVMQEIRDLKELEDRKNRALEANTQNNRAAMQEQREQANKEADEVKAAADLVVNNNPNPERIITERIDTPATTSGVAATPPPEGQVIAPPVTNEATQAGVTATPPPNTPLANTQAAAPAPTAADVQRVNEVEENQRAFLSMVEEFDREIREENRARANRSWKRIFWNKFFNALTRTAGLGIEATEIIYNYVLGNAPAIIRIPGWWVLRTIGIQFTGMVLHAGLVSIGLDPWAIQQALLGYTQDLYNPNVPQDEIYVYANNLVSDIEKQYYNLDYTNSNTMEKTWKYTKGIFSGAWQKTKDFTVNAKIFSKGFIDPEREQTEIQKFLKNYEILDYTNDASLETSKKYFDMTNDRIAYLDNYRKDLNVAWKEYTELFYTSTATTELNEQKKHVAAKLSDLLKRISYYIYGEIKDSVYIPQYFDTIVKQIDQKLTNLIIESRTRVAQYYKHYNKQQELLNAAHELMISDINHPLWDAVYPMIGIGDIQGYDVTRNPLMKYELKPGVTMGNVIKAANLNLQSFYKEDLDTPVSNIFNGKNFFHVYTNPERLSQDKFNEFDSFIKEYKDLTKRNTAAQRVPLNSYIIWRVFGSKNYEDLTPSLKGLILDNKPLVDFVTTAYGAQVEVDKVTTYNKQVALKMREFLLNSQTIAEEDYNYYIRNLWFKYYTAAETASGANFDQYAQILDASPSRQYWLAFKRNAKNMINKVMSNPAAVATPIKGFGRKDPGIYIKRKAWDLLTKKPDKKTLKKKEINCGVCNSKDDLYKIDNNRSDIMCKDCIGKGKRSKAGKLPAFLAAEKKTPIENDPVLKKLKSNRLFNKLSSLYYQKVGDEHFDKSFEEQTKHIPSEQFFGKGLPHEYHDYDHFTQDDKLNHLTKLFMKINLNKANDNEKYNYLRLGKHYIEKHGEGINSPLNYNKLNNFVELRKQIAEDPTKLFRINIDTKSEL